MALSYGPGRKAMLKSPRQRPNRTIAKRFFPTFR